MHIKTGTWEPSNTVCESDPLCDPAALVSAANPEPHIRNRRLSPGSGNCGGGGGGGCLSGGEQQQPRQPSPDAAAPGHAHTALSLRRDKERKGPQHKGRGVRREGQKAAAAAASAGGRAGERTPKAHPQKERWVEDSLSLLRPPPAFPVQDSPAKLQPAVSYASKVKAGAAGGPLEEDRPAIGVLLQNQWGLSFISETRPAPAPAPAAAPADPLAPQPADPRPPPETALAVRPPEDAPSPAATSVTPTTRPEADENNGKLLLSCRHLVEALNFHNREWNALCNKQKKDPKRVVWYKDAQEQPA